jgi:glycosyltransferase involved in cell wall biosynthesis
MHVLNIVNPTSITSKSSVPNQWNKLFQDKDDGNVYKILGLGIKAFKFFLKADIVHAYHIKSGFIFVILSKIFRKKVVYTLTGSIDFASPLNTMLFNIIAIYSNKLVVVSPSLVTGLENLKTYNVFKNKVEVIPCGVDLNIKKVRDDLILEKFNINPEAKIIFHPARFVREKNHINLLRAFKNVTDELPYQTLLVLSGGGKLHDELVTEIAKNGLQNSVILTGLISRVDVLCLLEKCDLYVMPSISEGLNVSFLEALAKKKKIVVSNIPSFESFFNSSNTPPELCNTKLVNPYDIKEISNEIISQLHKDKINDFDRSFIDVNEMIDSYCLLYKGLLTK